MKKMRLSYSLLSAWLKGNPQEAVEIYFRLEKPTNRYMEDGKRIHKDIQEHIETFNTFPDWLFNGSLTLPTCEMPIVVPYNEMFDLKAVFDCYDRPTLYEFKTGSQDSLTWTRTHQIPLYFLVAELAGMEVDKALLIRYNQYENKHDFAQVWNSKRLVDKARNFIDSYGVEIYDYFKQEGLIS